MLYCAFVFPHVFYVFICIMIEMSGFVFLCMWLLIVYVGYVAIVFALCLSCFMVVLC